MASPVTSQLEVLDAVVEDESYDPIQEEPEVTVLVKSSRHHDGEKPHSRWDWAYVVEGVRNGSMTDPQRWWTAAMLRHAAALIEEGTLVNPADRRPPVEKVIRQAHRMAITARLAIDQWFDIAHDLVDSRGLNFTAAAMRVKVPQLARLMRGYTAPPVKRDTNELIDRPFPELASVLPPKRQKAVG